MGGAALFAYMLVLEYSRSLFHIQSSPEQDSEVGCIAKVFAMIESPWKNERVLESFTVAVFVLDADWCFSYVNPTAEKVLQRSATDLVGTSVWREFPEMVGSIFEDEYRRAREENIAVRFEAFYGPLDVWVQVYAYPADGGVTVILQDITERKTAEQDARRLEARNRAIVSALPDDLYLLSESGVLVEAEIHTRKDRTADDILGRTIDEVFPERVARRFWEAIDQVKATQSARVFSYQLPAQRSNDQATASGPLSAPPESTDVAGRDGTHSPDPTEEGRHVEEGRHGSDGEPSGASGEATSLPRSMEARVVPVESNGVLAIVRDVTKQRNLERRVLEITERERERIGRDLHDGIGSLLSGISMMSRSLAHNARDGDPVSAEKLDEISRLAKEGVRHARALSRGLNPVDLDPERFVDALREMVSNTQTVSNVECILDDPDDIHSLRRDVAEQLYWIAQEAVTNATRHSGCERLAVGFWIDGDDVLLRIRDDGVGCPGRGLDEGSGMGIRSMQYRAEGIGARLQLQNWSGPHLQRQNPEAGVDDGSRASTDPTNTGPAQGDAIQRDTDQRDADQRDAGRGHAAQGHAAQGHAAQGHAVRGDEGNPAQEGSTSEGGAEDRAESRASVSGWEVLCRLPIWRAVSESHDPVA